MTKQINLNKDGRNSLLQGRAHKLVVLSTMAIPEIIHKYNMIQTEQIIFRNTYVSTHIHVIIINEKGPRAQSEQEVAYAIGKED